MKTDSTGQIQPPATALATREATPQDTLIELVRSRTADIAQVLPRHLSPDRMARITMTAIRRTPKLAECDRLSFLGSLFSAAAIGLEPNTPLGHAYLIPYGKECQLVIGYQGMIELARRSGQLKSIQAFAVYEADAFDFSLGLDPNLHHVPNLDHAGYGEPESLVKVYAVATLESGERVFEVLTRKQVLSHRDRGGYARAKARNATTPWDTDFVEMARKTAIRAIFRWLPKSAELARAEELEQATDRGSSAVDADILEALPELESSNAQ